MSMYKLIAYLTFWHESWVWRVQSNASTKTFLTQRIVAIEDQIVKRDVTFGEEKIGELYVWKDPTTLIHAKKRRIATGSYTAPRAISIQ